MSKGPLLVSDGEEPLRALPPWTESDRILVDNGYAVVLFSRLDNEGPPLPRHAWIVIRTYGGGMVAALGDQGWVRLTEDPLEVRGLGLPAARIIREVEQLLADEDDTNEVRTFLAHNPVSDLPPFPDLG